MTAAHPTPTPVRILQAAETIVVRDGVANLTLEAAAREAGVSKGGVLYHFPSRDALVTAMVERLTARYQSQLARCAKTERGPGRATRAYVKATFEDEESTDTTRLGAALIAAVAAEPALLDPLRQAAASWQRQVVDDGLAVARATVVRLAADGLWLSELFGLAPLSPELRRAVERELRALARPPRSSARGS